MKSSPKIGCTIRNEKDPYQIQCAFSTDPEDKRDFSVYFHSPDGRQEIMAKCAHNERYECTFAHEGLSIMEDLYISVSETFSAQNGSFVCRNGDPALEQFPCFYSGKSVIPEVKGNMTDIGSSTLPTPGDFGTEDSDLAVIIGAVCGVVIILQFIFIVLILLKTYKYRKDRQFAKWYMQETVDFVLPVLCKRFSGEENEASDKLQPQDFGSSYESASNDQKKGGHLPK